MKYVHFEGSGLLAGLANMLEHLGHDTEDYIIALSMDAPWLFIKEGDAYLAGQQLYTPRWLDLYLKPRGFHIAEILLPKTQVAAFLRQHQPAMLPLTVEKERLHPVIFTGYEDGRYLFDNIRSENTPEPEHLSLSVQMLARRLEEQVTIFTLEKCPPEPVDFLPLLLTSLQNLADYEAALMTVCARTVTRWEFNDLRTPLLRALMVDAGPMARLLNQPALAAELHLLHHDYGHVFTRLSPPSLLLSERLPRSSIRKCIGWMRENIIDRMYDHGATDELVESLPQCTR